MEHKIPLSDAELFDVTGGVVSYNGNTLDGTKTIAELAAEYGLTETEAYKKIDAGFLNIPLNSIEGLMGTEWTQNFINKNFPSPTDAGLRL